jgi:hypothetical protein
VADFDQEIDRLFELPPEEFTAARNELARHLKSEGDTAASAAVKQLGKPTVAAWTINQLARQEKDAIHDLLNAGTTLREAQERALKADAGDALRQAQEEERRALRTLTQHAHQILEQAGRPATRSVLDQISSTLRAAAVSEEGRAALPAGRLSGEVKPSGFDALAGIEVAGRTRVPKRRAAAPPRDELAERRREKQEREQRRRELRERARKLDAEAREAEREAERAERAATKARAAAEERRRKADDAARKLDELEP